MKTKECLNCHKTFFKTPSMGNPYWEQRKLCGRDCQSEWMKGSHNSPSTEIPVGGVETDTTCIVCGSNFVAFSTNAKYCSNNCYKEMRRIQRKHRKIDPNVIRESNLRRSFDIGIAEYDIMMNNQNNRCAICKKHQSEEKRRFAVDHDHVTGRIRGLLCINCNRGLGAFMDSDEMIERAVLYLKGKL